MATEDLPKEFDIVVLGTGLTETIAAAAFSRIGLKVLHLDRNDYYGGSYGNFNLEAIESWKQRNNDLAKDDNSSTTSDVSENISEFLKDGETAVKLPSECIQAFNVTSKFHVRERTAEEEAAAKDKKSRSKFCFSNLPPVPKPDDDPNVDGQIQDQSECSYREKTETEDVVCKDAIEEKPSMTQNSERSETPPVAGYTAANAATASLETDDSVSETDKDLDKSLPDDSNILKCSESSLISSNEKEKEENEKECKGESVGTASKDSSSAVSAEANSNGEHSKEWTVGDIKDDWRRFCFDLSPRVLYCCGDLVELLIQSDVARYCEFRTVSRILTLLKDNLQQVPCSRADVFSSKIVSLIEKRLMMKFLQFAADYEKNPEEYKDHIEKPFVDFLKSKKLTANIEHFVQHAIAMVSDSTSTEVGLKKTQKFLRSLGRYGNTAFLFPLYGTGELPQAFSRLSAVFGGIYCLMLSASHIILDNEKKCNGIITSSGQKISSKYVVAEGSYLPSSYVKNTSNRKVSRAIFITDSSICPSEESELSLLNFVCKQDASRAVTVMELPSSACVCPKNLFVVHLTRASTCVNAEEDLKEARERIFMEENSEEEGKKPKILWSLYFTQEDRTNVELTSEAAENILVTSGGGDAGVDVDFCVEEAKRIFHTVCPEEEFLPKPPNPEDIIHVDDTEAAVASGPSEFESQEERKEIENDETKVDDKVEKVQEPSKEGNKEVDGAEGITETVKSGED